MRGFTVIETLVYLALYAIIIGGSLAAVTSIIASSARNETTAMVEEEGDYLTAKVDAALSGAVSVQSPVTTGSLLSITRSDGSTVSFSINGTNMQIQEGAENAEVLNNSNVSVEDLSFINTLASNDGLDPESVSVSFTLIATTSDGHALSRDFSSLEYLRK